MLRLGRTLPVVKAFPAVKSSLRGVLIVLIATLLSGCAAAGYDSGAARRHLVGVGISSTAATCVVDHMSSRFGDGRLGARADPSAAELKAEQALLKVCGVKA
jgi:hypothetical protein